MDERELLDMMITERIQILVKEMKPTSDPTERENALLLMQRAEGILKRLSEQDRTLMEEYMDFMTDSMVDHIADEEPALYIGGFKDGIRVMKFINSL